MDVAQPKARDVVEIHGLQKAQHFNGRKALVLKRVTEGPLAGRFQVLPGAKGGHTIAVQSSNLRKVHYADNIMTERCHQMCFFWPNKKSKSDPSPPFVTDVGEEWPPEENDFLEKQHLKSVHGWTEPALLSGITSQGQEKPDFQMYVDTGDTVSPINHIATTIAKLLPSYEISKASSYSSGKPIHGPCVFMYSPTKSSFFGSSNAPVPVPNLQPGFMSSNANKQWSLESLQHALQYHMTSDAEDAYRLHDNPMHRVFGGIPQM
eukprot:scaffold44492_cov56-Attheya_sp.AAC.1